MALNLEQCPNCDNIGYTIESQIELRPSEYWGDSIKEIQVHRQVQCEFCYTNENSIFNYNKMIERLKGEHLK